VPEGAAELPELTGATASPRVSVTRTASRRGMRCFTTGSNPCRYFRRQVNTWLALTANARAIRATEALGARLSSTILRLSLGLRYCRLAADGGLGAEAGPRSFGLEVSISLQVDTN
jgi:hypothetical protein